MFVAKMLAAKMFIMKSPSKILIRSEEFQASQTYSADSVFQPDPMVINMHIKVWKPLEENSDAYMPLWSWRILNDIE